MARQKQAGPFVLFIMGLIFASVGLAVVYYFGHDIELNCSRSDNKCIIEKTNVFGDTEIEESFKLTSLAGAEVIEKRDSDGDYTYKVMLITDDGRIPLSDSSSSDRKSHKENTKKINNYVNSHDENLVLEQSGTFVRVFGFVFAGIGVLLLLSSLGTILGAIIKLIILFLVMIFGKK